MDTPIKYLSGEKIYLRIPYEEDAEVIYAGLNNESESRLMRGRQVPVKLTTVKQALQQPYQKSYAYLICLNENDEVIGEVSISQNGVEINRCGDFQIAIYKEEHFGSGKGTEATQLALQIAFGQLNLNRVQLEVFQSNERAINTYEKIGFIKEGIKRQAWYTDFDYQDCVMMSLLREEFINY
ncbi:GNAT family N-acetyltransferase [Pontibacillus yanchengensis]|uniref:GNAT family N-acetyltransferase n=1 Tax=Pontibacillus yanchengensis TaxID=462910 RepID=A0A6I5A5T0_9BACI|nr:GNAT family protein [Pontibacillus yanchengensis]MYL35639.1 GNAT family N-acetyltransferase [Pontibacillus yanchengensis]